VGTETLPGNAADPAEGVLPSLTPSEERYLQDEQKAWKWWYMSRESVGLPLSHLDVAHI